MTDDVLKPPSHVKIIDKDSKGVRIAKMISQHVTLDQYDLYEDGRVYDCYGRYFKTIYGEETGSEIRYPEYTLNHLDADGRRKKKGQGTQIHRVLAETFKDFPWPPKIPGLKDGEYQAMYNEIHEKCSPATIRIFDIQYKKWCNESYEAEHVTQDVKDYSLKNICWEFRRDNVGSSIASRTDPVTGKVLPKPRRGDPPPDPIPNLLDLFNNKQVDILH